MQLQYYYYTIIILIQYAIYKLNVSYSSINYKLL